MTEQQHPITPPPELVRQWMSGEEQGLSSEDIAAQIARWGADQELEACEEWMRSHFHGVPQWADQLRAARRPKPPSRADAALKALEGLSLPEEAWTAVSFALERLQELEGKQ